MKDIIINQDNLKIFNDDLDRRKKYSIQYIDQDDIDKIREMIKDNIEDYGSRIIILSKILNEELRGYKEILEILEEIIGELK